MWFAIFGTDNDDSSSRRISARQEHLERLQLLVNEGRLLVAGPHPRIECEDPGPAGYSGSLIVAEFDSLKDAENWANADPYVLTGVFRDVAVKPFRLVLP